MGVGQFVSVAFEITPIRRRRCVNRALLKGTRTKFRFPVVIIDEDWRAESASGLGIRALAKALEDEGMEVVRGFTYVDVGMVANQAARASAFVVSIDDEEINEDGEESTAVVEPLKFIEATRRRNADVPIFPVRETRHLAASAEQRFSKTAVSFTCSRTRRSSRRG